ncbi:MAG: IclR family transcriptional regulator [Lautropia sp.]
MHEKTEAMAGTRSAAKALTLLRHVGAYHGAGIRLRELVALSGLDRSTTHRLLACLVEQGFVERVGDSKLYRLGIEALQWGFSADGLASVVDRFRPAMQRLARQTGDNIYLMVRSGDFVLCLHREERHCPVKAFVVEAGMRRPLGVSAVGVAMLARLPEPEAARLLERHRREYERIGVSCDDVLGIVRRARRVGFSEVPDFSIEETSGVGCAFALTRHSDAGISIAAINSRMLTQRRAELGRQLVREFCGTAAVLRGSRDTSGQLQERRLGRRCLLR